jgi:hypothetical protein
MLLNVVQERMGETLFDCVVVGLGPAGAILLTERVARLPYGQPRANFRLIGKYRELIGLFIEVLMGREGFSNLLSMLKCKMGLKGKIAG